LACRRTDSAAAPLDDVACRLSQPTPAETPDTGHRDQSLNSWLN